MPSASQSMAACADGRATPYSPAPASSRRAAGWEISVATSGMKSIRQRARAAQERDPDSRADRQRQVGAGAGPRRAHRRRHRQHRFHAGLFGARRADGAAGATRISRARRIASTAMSIPRRRLFDRRLAARRDARSIGSGDARRRRGRSSSAAPGSISGRCSRAFRRCRRFPPNVRDRWRYELVEEGADSAAPRS